MKRILTLLGSITVLGILILPSIVSAETTGKLQLSETGIGYASGIGIGSQDIRTTISSIIRVAMSLLGIGAVLIVLYGGFKWMTSLGGEGIDDAKNIIKAGLFGLIIIFLAYSIANFVLGSIINAT